jgi:hypothetical protein
VVVQFEFVDKHAGQIAPLFFSKQGLAGNRFNCLV